MHPYTYNFSFRVYHTDKDLTETAVVLGNIPGFSLKKIWKAGDARISKGGKKEKESNYTNSYCYFSIFERPQSSDVKDLSQMLRETLSKLESQKKLLHALHDEGAEMSFFVGWYIMENSGETFTPELIKKLADLNIALEFDLYPPEKVSV